MSGRSRAGSTSGASCHPEEPFVAIAPRGQAVRRRTYCPRRFSLGAGGPSLRSGRQVGAYPATASSTGSSVFGASHSLPHLRHLRKSPRALVNFISAPTKPHSGHFSFTGLFHATKSQSSLEQA